MLTATRTMLQTTWRRFIASIIVDLFPQNIEAQKRLSWARFIESYAAVPDIFRGFFEPLRADGREFPYTILTPTFEGFIRSTTEKLVCDCGDEIVVLERSGNTFEAKHFPLEKINNVEIRTILLDSCIKIDGVTQQGAVTSSTFIFNSVTDYLFVPILNRIRHASILAKDAVRGSDSSDFDEWSQKNRKFMNYARRSLLAGDTVIHAILQPEIRIHRFTILGRTYYRQSIPAHAAILTDHELILIREEERKRADARYSGIWNYIPINRIATLSVQDRDSGLLGLSISLSETDCIELLFQASAKQEVDELLAHYRALTAKERLTANEAIH